VRYTVLDELGVGCDARGYLARAWVVEEGDVLAENGGEVGGSQGLGDAFACVGEALDADGCADDAGDSCFVLKLFRTGFTFDVIYR
jgi:hypothetical protein